MGCASSSTPSPPPPREEGASATHHVRNTSREARAIEAMLNELNRGTTKMPLSRRSPFESGRDANAEDGVNAARRANSDIISNLFAGFANEFAPRDGFAFAPYSLASAFFELTICTDSSVLPSQRHDLMRGEIERNLTELLLNEEIIGTPLAAAAAAVVKTIEPTAVSGSSTLTAASGSTVPSSFTIAPSPRGANESSSLRPANDVVAPGGELNSLAHVFIESNSFRSSPFKRPSLDDILKQNDPRRRGSRGEFQQFLANNLADENLEFLDRVAAYKAMWGENGEDALSPPEMRSRIKSEIDSIVSRFIVHSGPKQINLPSTIRKPLELAVPASEAEVLPSHRSLFDEAEREIRSLLQRDTVDKFLDAVRVPVNDHPSSPGFTEGTTTRPPRPHVFAQRYDVRGAEAQINARFEYETEGHVVALIPPQSNADSRGNMVLGCASYFSGPSPWESRFHACANNASRMRLVRFMRHVECAGFEIVEVPLLTPVTPHSSPSSSSSSVSRTGTKTRSYHPTRALFVTTPPDFCADFFIKSAELLLPCMQYRLVDLEVPSTFGMGEGNRVRGALARAGVKACFEKEGADFRNLSNVKDPVGVWLSDAFHACVIQCDENGVRSGSASPSDARDGSGGAHFAGVRFVKISLGKHDGGGLSPFYFLLTDDAGRWLTCSRVV